MVLYVASLLQLTIGFVKKSKREETVDPYKIHELINKVPRTIKSLGSHLAHNSGKNKNDYHAQKK